MKNLYLTGLFSALALTCATHICTASDRPDTIAVFKITSLKSMFTDMTKLHEKAVLAEQKLDKKAYDEAVAEIKMLVDEVSNINETARKNQNTALIEIIKANRDVLYYCLKLITPPDIDAIAEEYATDLQAARAQKRRQQQENRQQQVAAVTSPKHLQCGSPSNHDKESAGSRQPARFGKASHR